MTKTELQILKAMRRDRREEEIAEAKDHKGCGEWMVRSHEKRIAAKEGDNASEGVHASGSESRE